MDINSNEASRERKLLDLEQSEESSSQKGGIYGSRPPLSQIQVITKDHVDLKSHLKSLSTFSSKAGNDVTKSLINDLRNTGLLKGFAYSQCHYTSQSTGILFDVVYQNLNNNALNLIKIVFNKSLEYENNCTIGSKEQYYSYWIWMRFNKWIEKKTNGLKNQ